MKRLILVLLVSLNTTTTYAADSLPWQVVELPELQVLGDPSQNLGIWFDGDFGWLNTGYQLWITDDAGRNWRPSLNRPITQPIYDSYFVNPQHGWVVGSARDAIPLPLFETQDGGFTWSPVILAELTQTSDAPEDLEHLILTRVYFKDAQSGLGTFLIDRFPYPIGSILARTTDGGRHWTEIGRNIPYPRITGFGDQVWIGCSYSPDFGETYQNFVDPRCFSARFISPLIGWSRGDHRKNDAETLDLAVMKTIDGGHTWTSILRGTTVGRTRLNLFGWCLLSEEIGATLWIGDRQASIDSLLYITHDGGTSWSSSTVPVNLSYDLFAIQTGDHMLGCNSQRSEVWIIPSLTSEDRIFYTSLESVTAVTSSGKRITSWGQIKQAITAEPEYSYGLRRGLYERNQRVRSCE